MYRRFKHGIDEVEDVVQRSLSNLSVADLQPSKSPDKVDPEVLKKVEECWEQIGSQCVEYAHQSRRTKIVDDGEWKTVRIFVSSTFTDFFCEREVLVKKVFPELREWCHERLLYVVDCDLRWGVPKDTTTAETIAICLEELNRCIEETNGEPFFLNMTGERYGWIPTTDDLPDTLRQKFQWIPDTSITFMEVLHGAYRMQNPNALFMMRDSTILDDIPEDQLSRYKDTDELQVQQLKQLKIWLQSRFPEQVLDYSCKVDGLIRLHEKEMVNITGLEDFSEQVLKFFKAAISRTFPDRTAVKIQDSKVLMENASQKKHVEELADNMLGRKNEAEQIFCFLQGQTSLFKSGETKKPYSRDPEYWQEFIEFENSLLCLTGPSGYGKTTLLAYVTQQAIKNGMTVFYHFCGSSGNSQHVLLLLQRLAAFLKQDYSTEYLETLYQLDEGKLQDIIRDSFLTLKDKPSDKPIVIVFEALNQLSSADYHKHMSWLPPKFPASVYCIVSSTQHPPTISRIQEHPHYSLKLEALNKSDAKDIIQLFLQRFNKRLDNDQLSLILDSKCSQSPLWLYLICEELRIYGDYRSLTKHVQSVTTSIDDMIEAIVRRLIKEDDTKQMEKAMSLLACSNSVVTAQDLQKMLGNIADKNPLPQLMFAQIKRALSPYLRVAHYNDQITFVHINIKNVILDCLVKKQASGKQCHTLLADYIEYWSDDKELKVEALPYHLQQAVLRKRLVHFIREVPESSRVPLFRRSAIMSDCRCRNLADSVIQGVVPAYLCVFCQHKRAVYFPNGYHMNENMCVVCGNHTFNLPNTSRAHLCNFHSVHQQATVLKCFLCSNIVTKNQAKPALLCQHCGFGNNGKRCAALDMHLS
ncbi:NACHT and WD repeat domain-containing protein 2-like [Ruditapes philippinarum]|uniref:NACHT and WD repeat domain-containing protein 2-like n=1 Tax=Ruditapes philippinarum TaxID=129788 RepID=UPI00295B1D5E|nr:NACHT and WD repeat domain-containing protein 2-like [Ruditapes philippinarum]XP_060585451.1 NACHT and WD repeat domain-containing protein 2-like [Ruditapes philippinarum]XP_060585452.1 NACHT and WD repeat domain-containing protein 2-like [Ruditapes philippinarum]